ncbi:hypothetical protein EDEG_02511 [Edhazardia aedis USNM 41457]|uniref:Uncharacterized protein n=1 Tax=Edhazardia aedis (strain USNM 41457) TaxID=1003232 RepID=J8ZTY0_EDHAE|nr:hypothetical protein EDEG_02511 [Edhazardia aedis USNM 41457]|eukprot:EJW03103.1 hypothetical protein EDEG_02511 [Edhazardia aedis USNM 41457]
MGNKYIDIANLFCESAMRYEKDNVLIQSRGLSAHQKKMFLRRYTGIYDTQECYEKVEQAASFSHWIWFLWARYNFKIRKGPSVSFNYKEFAASRLGCMLESGFLSDLQKQKIEEISGL